MKPFSKPVLKEECFKELTTIVHALTGITIKPQRRAMLEGRLQKRLRALELADFPSYIKLLRYDATEQQAFVNSVTTNETYFYRTPRIWEYIWGSFLTDWQKNNPGSTLHAWSAASSTGEEAHTLGIVMQAYKDKNPGFNYKIQGTDIDSSVVQKATEGQYNGRSIERFRNEKPEWFSRYMTGNDDRGYTVSAAIKKNLHFSELNLFDAKKAHDEFSLVLIRNVLIYFSDLDQERVMNVVHKRMRASGVVIIGESETLNNLSTEFVTLAPTIYRPSNAEAGRKAA